jgi:hypothetical protein
MQTWTALGESSGSWEVETDAAFMQDCGVRHRQGSRWSSKQSEILVLHSSCAYSRAYIHMG